MPGNGKQGKTMQSNAKQSNAKQCKAIQLNAKQGAKHLIGVAPGSFVILDEVARRRHYSRGSISGLEKDAAPPFGLAHGDNGPLEGQYYDGATVSHPLNTL